MRPQPRQRATFLHSLRGGERSPPLEPPWNPSTRVGSSTTISLVNVEIVKVVDGRRRVSVDGVFVGEIECVHLGHDLRDCWNDYRGTLRSGNRWLPTGVTRRSAGRTPSDAALLLLALEGYDRVAAIEVLYPKGRVYKAA